MCQKRMCIASGARAGRPAVFLFPLRQRGEGLPERYSEVDREDHSGCWRSRLSHDGANANRSKSKPSKEKNHADGWQKPFHRHRRWSGARKKEQRASRWSTAKLNQTVKYFARVVLLEGISYVLLLLLPCRWNIFFDYPMAVKVVGWAHGVLFMEYAVFLVCVGCDANGASGVVFISLPHCFPCCPFLSSGNLSRNTTILATPDRDATYIVWISFSNAFPKGWL